MRTNIMLDDQLIVEALRLSGVKTKKEVVNFALRQLVKSLKQQSQKNNAFISRYIDQPIQLESFSPLKREDIYER